MEAFRFYKEALDHVQSRPGQRSEHVINASVVSAVQGHYGDYHATERTHGSRLWISPLMPLYWFFDADSGCRTQPVFALDTQRAQTRREVMQVIANVTGAFAAASAHSHSASPDEVPVQIRKRGDGTLRMPLPPRLMLTAKITSSPYSTSFRGSWCRPDARRSSSSYCSCERLSSCRAPCA